MSHFSRIRIAAAIAAAAVPLSSALAVDMTATAEIVGACQMVAATAMDFGTLNQVTAADLTGIGSSASYKCTSGVTPTLTVGGATSGATGYSGLLTKVSSTETIAYKVTWGAVAAGTGFSAAVSVPLAGEMLGTAYKDQPAGTYTEAVAITVTP